MVYPDTFEGFMVNSHEQWSYFQKQEFKPKPLEDWDVEIAIEACGVCGSDVHTLTGGWGQANLPVCVGHEVVGKVVAIGPEATTVKIGDRVGVGAQVWACLECKICKSGNENYCPHQVDTYNCYYPDKSMAYGGYASHIRAHEYFVFAIPESLESSLAAPMLCAGITSYSPLSRAKIGPGKTVGVVGIGGLGHFGILFAAALGAEVYAISHSPNKEADAKILGAKGFICTKGDGWNEPWRNNFDFILNTTDATDRFDMAAYFSLLTINGTFHTVGISDKAFPPLRTQDMMGNGCSIAASHIGSRQEVQEMLLLAAKLDIKSWVETIDISEQGCKIAVEKVVTGDVRYRVTLVGYDKVFGARK
ncbi:NADPH-dependent medium chain alcohol dehydrogenase [Penicillium cataractarum]|uniref:alcohol dehydrogenase (NADP(+)) n=1 Tax=Penicillium cataractarum TaxID=2100454 RepID=A0A9W9V2S8_9EURO|nr:NADPH-dependent medium chain alcohol dehydrogenase [Penicillium cataractarum]KAJ5364405.1 NADPH-dependent medium chain alcohol dehydrogenase [Penicillium cataractarum]